MTTLFSAAVNAENNFVSELQERAISVLWPVHRVFHSILGVKIHHTESVSIFNNLEIPERHLAALKNGIDNTIIQRDKNEDKNWIQCLRERGKKSISFINRTRDYL